MWDLDHKESWAPKNWCFWTVVLEKTLENPLDSKEIKPVNAKENQSWKFIRRTDAEAKTPILWPPDAKNWLIGKDPDAGKDWRQEEKGMAEDKMIGWHHRLDWTWGWASSGFGDEQGSLACCSPWGRKESTWLNNSTELMLGKTECERRKGQQSMRWLDSIINSMDMNLSKLQEIVTDMEDWSAAVHGLSKSWTWLSNWTTTHNYIYTEYFFNQKFWYNWVERNGRREDMCWVRRTHREAGKSAQSLPCTVEIQR